MCYFCLEYLPSVFLLSTNSEVDVNAATNWATWRISLLACFLRCQRFSWRHLHSGAEETRSGSPPRPLCEHQIRLALKEETTTTFTPAFISSTFSNALPLLFTGHLHVSGAGYRVRRLLCAITGKTIRGVSYTHTHWRRVFWLSAPDVALKAFVLPLEPPSQSGCSWCHLHGSRELRPWALHLFDRSVWCLRNQSTELDWRQSWLGPTNVKRTSC